MEIKVGDKFEEVGEGIYWIINKIENGLIYHYIVGKFSTLPNSEIKRKEIFEWMLSKGLIRKV